jgi:glycosyltransferase involved in cell wall biosynthesis
MNQKIKILYIIPAEGFGGAERQALLHLKEMPGYGIDVIAVTGPGDKVYKAAKKTCCKVEYCPKFPFEYGRPFNAVTFIFHAVKFLVCWWRTTIYVCKLIKRENINLIFASRATGWIIAAPISKLLSIPCIWRFGSRVHGKTAQISLKVLARLMIPDAVIANCRSVETSVKDLVGIPVDVIYNGMDQCLLKVTSEKMDLFQNNERNNYDAIIGMAVRPSPDKGLDLLNDIIAEIDKMQKTVKVFVAGEFGWREKYQEQADRLNLCSSITFLGYVSNIQAFYNACDIVIMTSKDKSIEGFPNALMEAMAIGKPVVATAVGGIPELIDNGRTGMLVGDLSPYTFATHIVGLIERPDIAQGIGMNARNHIITNYYADKTVRPVVDIIKRIVNCRCQHALNMNMENTGLPVRENGI